MPTYQYACTECGHAFEQVQNFTDDTLTACPECSGKLRKIFNAVGVVFKGSGFYRNDSRSTSNTSDPATPSRSDSSKSESGSSSDSGSDSGSKKSESTTGTSTATKTDSGSKSASKSS